MGTSRSVLDDEVVTENARLRPLRVVELFLRMLGQV
jgi:hypothetical protein